MNIKSLIILILTSFLGVSNLYAESLVISSPPIAPVSGNEGQPGYLKKIVQEAGKRVGIDISFEHMPAQRSLHASNSGHTDGELHRIEGLEKFYPNLIRVPEAVLIDQFVGFSAKPDVRLKDWQHTGSLTISYPRGWTIYETAFGDDRFHHPGLDAHSLFKMAAAERIDIAMHTLDKGSFIIHTDGLKLYPVTPVFAVKPMYVYLHQSKAHLVEKLAASFAEVKKDGTYSRIKKEILYSYGLTDKAYFQSPIDQVTHNN